MTYTLPHVDIQSWIEAGDPVDNVDMDASQAEADTLLINRLTDLYPEHEFVFKPESPSAFDNLRIYEDDDPSAEDIGYAYEWVFDNADAWLTYNN